MGYGQSDSDDVRSQQVSLTVNTENALELPTTSSLVASKKVSLSPALKAGLPILTYCIASIVMTVTNKFVVSGDFNMVFFLLTVQVQLCYRK
jgi:GDP-mannose transporter